MAISCIGVFGDREGTHINLNYGRPAWIMTRDSKSLLAKRATRILYKRGFSNVTLYETKFDDCNNKQVCHTQHYVVMLNQCIKQGHEYCYFFEDDVNVVADVDNNIETDPSIEPKHMFQYLGMCKSKREMEQPLDYQHMCGMCTHALAFTSAGAKDFVAFYHARLEAKSVSQAVLKGAFDMWINEWCKKHGGFPLYKPHARAPDFDGHIGAFYQDMRYSLKCIGKGRARSGLHAYGAKWCQH